MNVVEVRRLSAQGRAVVDNFELNLATGVINDRHSNSPVGRKSWKAFPPGGPGERGSQAQASPHAERSGKHFLSQKSSRPSRWRTMSSLRVGRVWSRARAGRSAPAPM